MTALLGLTDLELRLWLLILTGILITAIFANR